MDAKLTGELIARRRKELGLSQAELAEQIHVTDKAVSRWETGRGTPAVNSLEPLAQALGLSVSELLSGRELTPEELPKAADDQIMTSMKKNNRMLWKGVLIAVSVLVVLAVLVIGIHVGYHYFTTVEADDMAALARAADQYINRHSWDEEQGLCIVKSQQQGDYLAALLQGDDGSFCMCVYDRDKIFPDRWLANGGKPALYSGKLTSWNFGSPQREAVIVVCGYDLPENAAYYMFRNNGTVYIRPVDEQVLDLFIIPDGISDISAVPVLLDENLQAVDGRWQSYLEDLLQYLRFN